MKQLLVPGVLAILCGLGIAAVQPGLAQNVHKVKQLDDVALLPPPDELRAMSLGYRGAMADVVWSQLVYQYGLRWVEHRPFPDVMRYIDAILALDPESQNVFLYADTLVMYRPEGATEEDARAVRALLERGTKQRPYDPEVWLRAGQYEAFLGPSFLKDDKELDEWRRAGALKIAHAVELGSNPDRSLAAASILRKSGERDAALRIAQVSYAMTDDPELKRQLLFKIKQNGGTDDAEQAASVVDSELRGRWGFLSRGTGLLIGPARGPASCAGTQSYDRKRCVRDWQQFVDEAR